MRAKVVAIVVAAMAPSALVSVTAYVSPPDRDVKGTISDFGDLGTRRVPAGRHVRSRRGRSGRVHPRFSEVITREFVNELGETKFCISQRATTTLTTQHGSLLLSANPFARIEDCDSFSCRSGSPCSVRAIRTTLDVVDRTRRYKHLTGTLTFDGLRTSCATAPIGCPHTSTTKSAQPSPE